MATKPKTSVKAKHKEPTKAEYPQPISPFQMQVELIISFSKEREKYFIFSYGSLLNLPRPGDSIFTPEDEEGIITPESVHHIEHTFMEEDGMFYHYIQIYTEEWVNEK